MIGALRLFTYLIVAIMLLPIVVTGMIAFTSVDTVVFPPPGYSLKWVGGVLSDDHLRIAILRSLGLAVLAAVLAITVGLPCCFLVERVLHRGRVTAETVITAPRMVPEIVFVLALLIFFEKIRIAETLTGLLISHLLICAPFAFRTLAASVSALDRRLEWSSDILGATPTRRFLLVVMPQMKTALISALVFAFILSFNNVTMALLLSAVGERTLPVEMFTRMHVGGMNPVVPAISLMLALIGGILFIVLDRTVGAFSHLSGRA